MKKIMYIFVAVIGIMVAACENDGNLIDTSINKSLNSEYNSRLHEIAKIICKISGENDVKTEVQTGVNESLDLGLDEELRLTDVIYPTESKIISKMNESNNFTTQIRKELGLDKGTQKIQGVSSNNYNSLLQFVQDNNIQIYWPYSENWDGEEDIVIAIAEKGVDINKVPAYKRTVDKDGYIMLESITVDENYAKQHPVWVINENETNYEELPFFTRGEISKGNITYATNTKPEIGYQKTSTVAVEDPSLNSPYYIYRILLGKIKVTHQYDTWIAGGSEMKFRMVGSKLNVTNSNDSSVTADYSTAIISKSVTRKQIDNKTIIPINAIINSDWESIETINGFAIWEEDGGSSDKKIEIELGYDKYKGKISFNIGNQDEKIYQIGWSRVSYFSGNKLNIGNELWDGWCVYSTGDVYFSLPWSILPKAYY